MFFFFWLFQDYHFDSFFSLRKIIKIFFSIFKTRVHREYDNFNCIINKSKNEKIDKSDSENVYCFLLNEFSDEWNILFQKRINWLSNESEISNENLIKDTNFNKFANVNDILTKRLIQNLNHFCCVWMSSLNVTNNFDNSKLFAAELKFFFENNAIRFFDIDQNIIQSLNMFHHITTNFRKNELIVVRRFLFFYFYVVYEQWRVMKNIIDDNFINHSNELNHEIDCFHENRCHFH